jgi:hypothetical protein
MNNLYRGSSIDASYQVSVHLAEEFQRKRLKSERLTACTFFSSSCQRPCELLPSTWRPSSVFRRLSSVVHRLSSVNLSDFNLFPTTFSAYQSESPVIICSLLRSGNNFLFVGPSNSVCKCRSFLQQRSGIFRYVCKFRNIIITLYYIINSIKWKYLAATELMNNSVHFFLAHLAKGRVSFCHQLDVRRLSFVVCLPSYIVCRPLTFQILIRSGNNFLFVGPSNSVCKCRSFLQ